MGQTRKRSEERQLNITTIKTYRVSAEELRKLLGIPKEEQIEAVAPIINSGLEVKTRVIPLNIKLP